MSRYLVFSSVGRRSRHPLWMKDRHRKTFDLCLYNYTESPGLYSKDADYYVERQGTKFGNLSHFARKYPDVLAAYDAVLAIDDDMIIDTRKINNLFSIFSAFHLDLAQPGFAWNGLISHPITRRKLVPGLMLRFTNFVENNIVVFSQNALQRCLPTFEESISGYGLDFVWPKVLGYPKDKIAVIDCVSVKHPWRRFARSDLDKKLPRAKHKEEGLALLRKHGVETNPWHALFKEYGAVGTGFWCKALGERIANDPYYRETVICRLLRVRENARYSLIKRLRLLF